MKINLLLLLFLILSLPVVITAQSTSKAEKLIMENFNQQVQCWNKGDIDCYCQGYVKSEQTHTISSRGFTYGYDAIVAQYKKNWPKEKMGQLSFDPLKMEKLSGSAYLVHGKFNLAYEQAKPVSGYFTVIMKKIRGQWMMYADHTS